MDQPYRSGLIEEIAQVYRSTNAPNHHTKFPWLTGALGDPNSGIWFLGENPSLGQVERVRDPSGGRPTEEAQWWASRGDRLFREMLVKHGFKVAPIDSAGGWGCYITNVIKQPDYAEQWRGTTLDRQRAAAVAWAPVIRWELANARPILVVALGKTVLNIVRYLRTQGVEFPRLEVVQHYSYVALRPRGAQGPMHPDRVREYDDEFATIARVFSQLKQGK
jgi:hypothetical protein